MSLSWSPEKYSRHRGPRQRPGLDLIARLGDRMPHSIVDLGCGSGALLRALRRRWPEAAITGVDVSAAMLEAARRDHPDVTFIEADISSWLPPEPVDLVFSNAALHWVPDHRRLLPELVRCCRVLAVQMPNNGAAPAHRAILELAERPEWRTRLGDIGVHRHILPPAEYARLLARHARSTDVWETIYYQRLTGADPVLEWVRGTTLLPVYEALGGRDSEASQAFEAHYAELLRAAYPADEDGVTLFPFRRLFILAEA